MTHFDATLIGSGKGSLHSPRMLFLMVSLLTVVVASTATLIWVTYYANYPLWVEHAAYGMWANILFSDLMARAGYWTALRASLSGARHVLQPAILGAISPRLLASPHSHLVVTTIALYVFLILLACFVWRRTGNALLGLTAAVLFCTSAGLYDERAGMAVPWPDYQSMFFLSSAILSLGLYSVSKTDWWLALAGACVSLATLARDTGGVWAIVTVFPTLAWLMVVRFNRNGVRGVAKLLLWFGVTALPSVLLFVERIPFFQQYYMTSNAWQLRQPLGVATRSIVAQIVVFCGVWPTVTLGVLIAAALVTSTSKRWTSEDLIVSYWPLSFFVFLALNGYDATGVTKEVMYMVPGVVCASLTLGGGIDMTRRITKLVVAVAIAIAVFGAGNSAVNAYIRARSPEPEDIQLRTSQKTLAEALASIPQRAWWHSFSAYDWGTVVAASTFYDFGHYQPTENVWFHNKKSYWDASFPNSNRLQLQDYLFAQVEQRVDLAVVLKDADIRPRRMEEYSFLIASDIARRVQANPHWEHYRDVDTGVWGSVALYRNVERTHAANR